MKKQKKREEIDKKYKWDLTTIYSNDEAWYDEFENAKLKVKKVVDYSDLTSSAKRLLEYIEYSNDTERLLNKLYYYAHLNYDSDTLVGKYQKMVRQIEDLYNEYGELSSYVEPTLMKLNYEEVKKFYVEEPKLLEYEFLLEKIYRYQKHTLSEEQEKIVALMSSVFSSSSNTYEILNDSDMKFGTLIDEDGNEIELTQSNYSKLMQSENREVRKNAFNLMYQKYEELKNTITSIYTGDINSNIALAKIRNYSSAIEASLYSDNIDKSVYDNLVKTVNDNLNVLYRYYDLKKEVLGLDELHIYDVYAPMIKEESKEYSYEEAVDMVLDALSILGKDYINDASKAFSEGWIDVYNNVGKRTGAYSSGFYDTNPFMLLNYEDNYESVSTLAHELGHSMHTYYSCKNNPFHYSSYQIFVAEVASTVNELLLGFHRLNNSNDKNEKKLILNKLMELFRATIFRQTMFAEFEEKVYKARENKEILTEEYLSDEYYKLNKKYFGDNVIIDNYIRYEWERIPHFYYNFYVYKYATGLSAACYIVDGILNKKEGALDNYLAFLKTGGSDYPLNELKIAGVDMNNPEVINSAIKMFDELIDEFIKLQK